MNRILWFCVLSVFAAGLFTLKLYPSVAGSLIMVGFVLLAFLVQQTQNWKPFAFSCWVLSVVTMAMTFPETFQNWGPITPTKTISPLIQVIMFGMGATLSIKDFHQVLLEPKKVGLGMLLQFMVMPISGWMLASSFNLSPGMAAGVILIGSCPGGVASNVITYLAKGNVALSVTMTACSTMMSPVMTPLCMRLLAGQYVEIPFWNMAIEIFRLVIVPVVGGLLANYFLRVFHWRGAWVDRLLSGSAMIAICVVIGIIVARSRTHLVELGLKIFAIAAIHNAVGYLLGYVGSKGWRMNEADSRTVSIEVGMQNGGMASALASDVLKIPEAAIAGAIFGPWMSIAGAILASWWRMKDQKSRERTETNSESQIDTSRASELRK